MCIYTRKANWNKGTAEQNPVTNRLLIPNLQFSQGYIRTGFTSLENVALHTFYIHPLYNAVWTILTTWIKYEHLLGAISI